MIMTKETHDAVMKEQRSKMEPKKKEQTEQNILKGCGKVLRGVSKEVCNEPFECNCGDIIKEILLLCPLCKKLLEGYQLAQKETAEKVEKLKEWINQQHIHFNSVKGEDCDKECWGKTFPIFIDKIFNEDKT
jgi:hypothetical protein